MDMKIIGLAGTNGSGKDTVGHLLAEKYGYLFAGATEMLGEELTRRGVPHERVNKAALSAQWRREYGMGVIVDKAHEAYRAGSYNGLIVGSLRHPGEADKVHELGGTMLWVDADQRIRYDRVTTSNRGRLEDNKTFEEFKIEEAREMSPIGDSATLNMGAVKERADIVLTNNGNDIDAFRRYVEKTLGFIT
jgi:cytidylate kinase